LWKSVKPKKAYDAVIVGGGGHGLATAYYLAKNHGLANIAVLENPEHVVLGKEPVMHQGKAVGYVTSAYFGHTLGRQLAYAWVPAALSTQGTELSIRFFDNDYPATVGQDPQYDPQMKRLRS
jgi:glycine cleavage system aminomethyltransferase T